MLSHKSQINRKLFPFQWTGDTAYCIFSHTLQ